MKVVVTVSPEELEALVEHGRVRLDGGSVEVRVRSGPGAVTRARVAAYLAAHPDASANEVWRAIGGRRADVLGAVRSLRAARVVDEAGLATAAAPTRYLERGYQQSGEAKAAA